MPIGVFPAFPSVISPDEAMKLIICLKLSKKRNKIKEERGVRNQQAPM
jgi:hypothetical protein